MAERILIFIPWFGPWPEWMPFFLESCRANPTIDWQLIGDAPDPENCPGNVRYLRTGFAAYKALVSDRLGIAFDPPDPYKLPDIRPALPDIHRDLAAGYGFVGWGDLDLIYGDIRAFVTGDLLETFDAFSTHAERASGHFFLMRNLEPLVTAYRRIRGWRRKFAQPKNLWLDENAFAIALRAGGGLLGWLRPAPRCFFREAYTSPTATDRMRWYWRDGMLSNEFYPHRGFIYLHFMSWHGSRHFAGRPHIAPGASAPWQRLERIVTMDWRCARAEGFMISPRGIGRIDYRQYS